MRVAAIEKMTEANIAESTMARMLGGNASEQFGIHLVQKVDAAVESLPER